MSMRKNILAGVILLALAGTAQATQMVIVNVDQPGLGLNDPTVVQPVGGNPGTTLGQQRTIAYQYAADAWGSVINSAVPIKVQASFAALACTATTAVLGSARSAYVLYNFNASAIPNLWYPAALANAVNGADLLSGGAAIVSSFNANIGQANCLAGTTWYYGLDDNAPAGTTDFIDTVMHEIAHGLGFASTTNVSTGALLNNMGDVFSTPIFDHVSGLNWNAMTTAQRKASIVGQGLVFGGPTVTQEIPLVLLNRLSLNARMGASTTSYTIGMANFGPPANASNFVGQVAVVSDGSANPSQGCGTLINTGSGGDGGPLAGLIALAIAGGCNSGTKAFQAQLAGASGIIIVSNQPGPAPYLTDGYTNNAIPTVSLAQADGAKLQGSIPGVSVSLATVAGMYQGADNQGRGMLYAPPVLQPGSSLSHWDLSMQPHTLMEPVAQSGQMANLKLDLTPAALKDIGWTRNTANGVLGGGLLSGGLLPACDTGVPAVAAGGAITGASIVARANVCRLNPGLLGTEYMSCVNNYASTLAAQKLITMAQQLQVGVCATTTGVPPLTAKSK